MPNSILEQVTINLVTTLNDLTVANGHSANITFTRPLRKGRDPAPDSGVVFISGLAETEGQDVYNQLQRWLVTYEIEIYLFYSEDDTTPVDQHKANIFADITKLLMVDPQRGTPDDASGPHLAIYTFIRGFENFFDADGSFEGMTVTVDVDFRTFRNNPYQAG